MQGNSVVAVLVDAFDVVSFATLPVQASFAIEVPGSADSQFATLPVQATLPVSAVPASADSQAAPSSLSSIPSWAQSLASRSSSSSSWRSTGPGLCSAALRHSVSGTVPKDVFKDVFVELLDEVDQMHTYVPYGGGQPRGLSTMEQVSWMLSSTHPDELNHIPIDKDLDLALDFECFQDPGDVDRFRAGRLRDLLLQAERLESHRADWAAGAPPVLRPLVSLIHGPLIAFLIEACGHEDADVLGCLQRGFPFAGQLPASNVSVRPGMPAAIGRWSVQQLRAMRADLNASVLGNLRSTQWADDVMDETAKDVAFGAMRGPWKFSETSLSDISVSRRMPVREERSSGWKTRIVDDCSESGINTATQAAERLRNDTVDVLALMIRRISMAGRVPAMWKRDIASAFRRLPISETHLDLAYVVFLVDSVVWIAQHLAMPFGTTSAVHAWHRAGSLLGAIMRKFFMAPGAKFVDDFFGASAAGIKLTGGHCLDILGKVLGFPTKDEKSVSFSAALHILGTVITFIPKTVSMTVEVDPAKAIKWSGILSQILVSGQCSQKVAVKMAGRLSFAVASSTGRVGRAYIKPFFAQANMPLRNGRASWQLCLAAAWWIRYFEHSPCASMQCRSDGRHHVHAWTDAAGASRWLAAVIHLDGRFLWTRVKLPLEIWEQFLAREDEQIGGQELMAVPLLLATFEHLIRGSLMTLAIDNLGVVGGLIAGRGSAADHNAAIAQVWLDIAAMNVAPHFLKVDTACNLADGPTREDLSLIQRLGATWLEPRWPAWAMDFWRMNV